MKVFNLPEGWKFVSLYDLVDVIGGVSYSPEDITSSGVRVIRGGNIQGNLVELRDDDVFLPNTYKNSDNSLHKGDVILVASTGSVEALGRTATVWENMENVQIGAFLRILRPKQPKYAALVSAWLSSEHYFRYIRLVAKGTSINNISLNHIKGFKIPIPSDEKATSFTALYNAVAKKININRAINQNLEALAKQLYDYWFVQFDFPNEEGKPYKSSGGTMVWNKTLKREIPILWEVENLSSIAIVNQRSITKKDNITEIEYLDTSNLVENEISDIQIIHREDAPSRAQRRVQKNTILYSIVRPRLKHYGIVCNPSDNLIASTGFATIDSKDKQWAYYIYNTLTQKNITEYLGAIADTAASSYPSITPSDIENINIIIPKEQIVIKYNNIVSYLYDLREKISKSNQSLTKQRDELLPLLMNGQVTIKEDNQI